MQEIIDAFTELGLTDEQARNVIGSIRTNTKDEMQEALTRCHAWVERVIKTNALLDVVMSGAVITRDWTASLDFSVALNIGGEE